MTTPRTGLALYLTEINVGDWSALVRWYVETLGLHPALEDTAHQYALLEAGTGRIALKGERGDAPGGPRHAVRLVFEVADVDAERTRLAGRDVETSPPEDSPEGYRAIRLHDPEGTPITLFCWKDLTPS
jgi:predicted enzyme related to lactoylglutathione lyase